MVNKLKLDDFINTECENCHVNPKCRKGSVDQFLCILQFYNEKEKVKNKGDKYGWERDKKGKTPGGNVWKSKTI